MKRFVLAVVLSLGCLFSSSVFAGTLTLSVIVTQTHGGGIVEIKKREDVEMLPQTETGDYQFKVGGKHIRLRLPANAMLTYEK